MALKHGTHASATRDDDSENLLSLLVLTWAVVDHFLIGAAADDDHYIHTG